MKDSPVQTIVVPGYEGRAAHAPAGATIRITDLEGGQIGDFFVMASDDPDDSFSQAITHLVLFHLFPSVGEQVYSHRRRPLLTLMEDHSPGNHDTTFAPCDAPFYESMGLPEHPNCRDNFLNALSHLRVTCSRIPDPINLFQNSAPTAAGTYTVGRTSTLPGDYVEFRAETDLVVALTACSVDVPLNGIYPNGALSTALKLEITSAAS